MGISDIAGKVKGKLDKLGPLADVVPQLRVAKMAAGAASAGQQPQGLREKAGAWGAGQNKQAGEESKGLKGALQSGDLSSEEEEAAKGRMQTLKGHQQAYSKFGTLGLVGSKIHAFTSSWFLEVIIFVFTLIFGVFMQFFFPLLAIVGFAVVGVFALYKFFPRLTKWILFIFLLIVIFAFIFYSPLAKASGIDVKSLQVAGAESTKATAATQTQLSATFSCILGGKGCEFITDTYKSEQASSDYIEGTKDVGAKIENLGPAKDFYSGDTLAVQGMISAKGIYKDELSVNVGAQSLDIDKRIAALFGAADINWACTPSKIEGNLVRNQFFTCTHDGIAVEQGKIETVPVEVYAIALNTKTLAGKQFVLTSPDTLSTIGSGNKLDYFDYSQDDFTSKQIGDDSVNLAISATTREDVLSTDFDNFIAIQVTNPSAGTVAVKPKDVIVYVPRYFVEQNYISDDSQFKCATELLPTGETSPVAKCESNIVNNDTYVVLKPAEFATWYLKFNVLKNSLVSDVTLYVVAEATYRYENSQIVSIDVKGAPVTPTGAQKQREVRLTT